MANESFVTNFDPFKVPGSYDEMEANTILNIISMEKKEPLSVYNLKEFYSFQGIQLEEPNFELLSEYNEFIMQNLSVTVFEERWTYKPRHASHEIYGTPFFDYLLLYVNNKLNKRDFVRGDGIVPLYIVNINVIETLRKVMLNKMKNRTTITLNNNKPLYDIGITQ